MPRKMRSSFGCVQRLGRDRYRLRWWADGPDGRRRRTEIVHGTRREAERRMAEIRVATDERHVPTVGELWEHYELPGLRRQLEEGKLSQRTVQAYERRWQADVAPRWADVPCTGVRPRDIQEWLLPMTKSMGELSKAVLSLTLDRAVFLDLVQGNPCSRRYEYGRETRRDKRAYTPDELGQIWEAVRGTVAEAPFLLSAHGGLRVGEACAVRTADVEWREGCAVVHVRVQVNQRGEVLDRLKTRGSERTAVVLEPWASRLRELAGPTYVNEQVDGMPIHPKTVTHNWKLAVEGAGLPYQPMQALRPSYQTNMHWAGVPIEQTSRLLGHASTEMTLANYDRPSDDQLVNVVLDASAKMMNGTLRDTLPNDTHV